MFPSNQLTIMSLFVCDVIIVLNKVILNVAHNQYIYIYIYIYLSRTCGVFDPDIAYVVCIPVLRGRGQKCPNMVII